MLRPVALVCGFDAARNGVKLGDLLRSTGNEIDVTGKLQLKKLKLCVVEAAQTPNTATYKMDVVSAPQPAQLG